MQRSKSAYIGGVNAPLYTTDILRLAADMPYVERLADPMGSSEKRSPVCGSRVTVDVDVDEGGRVAAVGMLVRACALGQASAALLGRSVVGKSPAELGDARDMLTGWLAGEREEFPDWPGLDALKPARPHTARHASIRLAFEAAAEAAEAAAAR